MTSTSPSTTYDGVRVKAENVNDDVEMLDAELASYEQTYAHQYGFEGARTHNRAKDTDENSFQTICFDRPHLDHPHHHHLKCGHDIVTRSLERCGGNCMLSRRNEFKPSGKDFECPHPSCVKKRAPLRQKTVGRRCQLSHVYGRDLDGDALRRAEKAKYEATSRVPLSEKVFKSKRSPSPEPVAAHRAERSDKRRKAQATALVQRVVTEVKLDRSMARLAKLDVDDRAKSHNHDELSFPNHDVRTETYDGYKCACCKAKVEHVRYRCQECEEQHGDEVDLCTKCYDYRSAALWSRQPDHHSHDHKFMKIVIGAHEAREHIAEMRRRPEDQDKDFEMVSTFCICESSSVENMMECEKCDKPFHAGCVGEGLNPMLNYEIMEDDELERAHEADMKALRARLGDIPFLCAGCKEKGRKKMEDDLVEARARMPAAYGMGQIRGKKRRAEQSVDADGPDMKELFGEDDVHSDTEERTAKCAKTGDDLPTFGQWTVSARVPMRGSK